MLNLQVTNKHPVIVFSLRSLIGIQPVKLGNYKPAAGGSDKEGVGGESKAAGNTGKQPTEKSILPQHFSL